MAIVTGKDMEEYYIGGYYLVEGTEIKAYMDAALLPNKIWSISDCICDLHPDLAALSWSSCSKQNRREYQKKLNLTKKEFSDLQKEVDDLFSTNKIGWLEMFIDRDAAIHFAQKYLSDISDLKLFMIATTAEDKDYFLEEEKPKGNQGEVGVYRCLKQELTVKGQDRLRGFEVLGYELGGFHSFVCNSLEKDFSEKLKIKLNANGLIDSYADAERAADYASEPDVGAEPALWMPWAIYEIPLQKQRIF